MAGSFTTAGSNCADVALLQGTIKGSNAAGVCPNIPVTAQFGLRFDNTVDTSEWVKQVNIYKKK
jgi:hypothetical protein